MCICVIHCKQNSTFRVNDWYWCDCCYVAVFNTTLMSLCTNVHSLWCIVVSGKFAVLYVWHKAVLDVWQHCGNYWSLCQMLCDAMHKRTLSSYALSIWLSVRLYIPSKRINTSSKYYHRSPHHSCFSIPNIMAVFGQGSPNKGFKYRWGRKNQDSRPMSDDWWTVNSCEFGVKCITADADDDRHASVNLVYDSKCSTSFLALNRQAEENGIYLCALKPK